MRRPFLQQIKAQSKGFIRRQRDRFFPDGTTRDYRNWMNGHLARRATLWPFEPEPGLLSLLTAVWDGSPLPYFRALADSIQTQVRTQPAEWFIVANGCERPDLLRYLQRLANEPHVSVHYAKQNKGIVGGLRLALERASGRYVLPVDADDKLYPDALAIVASNIQKHSYPPLLYTDEDKIAAAGIYQPYFKPDWDPVLLSNSAYIAHWGVIDRKLALHLGAYSNSNTEGSADWDLFTRFANARHVAVHIPEIVYSWRIHAQSTADDAAAKPYIRSSQQAVMQSFLNANPAGQHFTIETSPLFGPNAAHLRFVRRHCPLPPIAVVKNPSEPQDLRPYAKSMAGQSGYVALLSNVQALDDTWLAEACGLFELFPGTVMVGGRIATSGGLVVDGPRVLGFAETCGCPDAGRSPTDPGYFGQLWKHRSVSALSARLCVIEAKYLLAVLAQLPPEATCTFLGDWIGAQALRDHRRIIYTPHLQATLASSAKLEMTPLERQSFLSHHQDLLPDRRFYPQPFSLTEGYRLAP